MAISKRPTSQQAFSVLFCTLFAACSGNSEETTPYCSPIAHAGDNLSLDLSSVVELDGSQSGYADDWSRASTSSGPSRPFLRVPRWTMLR